MAALKQTMVDKGMSAEEIERVILIDKPAEEKAASEAEADRSAVQFAVELSAQDMSPTDLERILETYKAADGKTRRMMAKLADEMFSNGANGAKVVAAVRALCQPAAKGVATEHGGSPYLNVNIH
jgi:acetylglutamate kinase